MQTWRLGSPKTPTQKSVIEFQPWLQRVTASPIGFDHVKRHGKTARRSVSGPSYGQRQSFQKTNALIGSKVFQTIPFFQSHRSRKPSWLVLVKFESCLFKLFPCFFSEYFVSSACPCSLTRPKLATSVVN